MAVLAAPPVSTDDSDGGGVGEVGLAVSNFGMGFRTYRVNNSLDKVILNLT